MSEIKTLCQHRWADIYKSFGVADSFLTKRNGPCPLCGGKDRFRHTDHMGYGGMICNACMAPEEGVDGFEFLMRYTGMSFKDIATDIKAILGDTKARPAPHSDVSKNRNKLRKIWAESKPLFKGCPTHLYLLNRGLSGLDFGALQGIRCHPGITYWHQEKGEIMNLGKHPAMVGLVTTTEGLPATLHCTYLRADGRKAALDPVRKIMTPSRDYGGGSVRLQSLGVDDVLCVAEGIETALAMKLMFPDLTPWACLSAGNMEKFVPPPECNGGTFYVGADNDLSYTGQHAAYSLAKKLSGKFKASVEVLMPKKQGHDFLDEYNEEKQVSA